MNKYQNKKVVIMGLGRMEKGSGIAAALFFAKQQAQVIVTDLRTARLLNKNSLKKIKKFKNIKIILGQHRKDDFAQADIIVKNPAVKPNSKFIKIAQENNAQILTDLGLFFEYINKKNIKIIGITGTRGKSTITTIIYEILKKKYKNKVYLGGNIGTSPLNFMAKLKSGDIVVMEIASFQLHDLVNHHFDIAVITNILPDHLDYYASMQEYQKDKENIFKNQNKNDFLILNQDDRKVKAMAKKANSKIFFYSKSKKVKLKEIYLLGEHSLYNIAAAYQVAKIMQIPEKDIISTVKNFKGVANRMELIREYHGIKFYNDTTSTHPQATIVALQALPKKRIILISGGNTKNIPLAEMAKEINKRVKILILFPGNANYLLPTGISVKNISQAVRAAWQHAQSGDTILFSPGLTWLPEINEFARGEVFVKNVKKIS